ncbi:MAG: hypothetical protein M0Z40_03390 [Actinomycetota bacterium]|nr:hypothetical protein [Actinomycetota bacterium]
MLTRAADGLDRLLLPMVVVVGAAGVAFPVPGRSVDGSGGIDPTLAVLVLTAGLSIDLAGLNQLRVRKARVLLAFATGTVALPVLAWALSRAAPTAARDGLLVVGVAPSEVASLALTGLAGGEVVVAAALLVASTAVTVVASGPVLALLAPARAVHPLGLLATLALVVALPLAAGASLAAVVRRRPSVMDLGRLAGVVALVVLLWEVASQVRLDAGFLVAAGLLVAFFGGAASLGMLVARGVDSAGRPGLVLPVAMRDFAVAAGIAETAFGAGSAGVLGVYGLLILLFGALSARSASYRFRAERP